MLEMTKSRTANAPTQETVRWALVVAYPCVVGLHHHPHGSGFLAPCSSSSAVRDRSQNCNSHIIWPTLCSSNSTFERLIPYNGPKPHFDFRLAGRLGFPAHAPFMSRLHSSCHQCEPARICP